MPQDTLILDVFAPGRLRLGDADFQCALGPAGIVTNKHEGDGATPAGSFALRSVMYRADRLNAPETQLPVRALSEDDGWCDDPQHEDYNRPVPLPHPAGHERLWRDDHIYDVIVEVGHNDDPPVPGNGSAIFMHIARDGYTPTQGCVALCLEDLLKVLRVRSPETMLRINPPE